jgi:hypothetical protein
MGARFSAPVQTGLGAHPASCTMGTGFFSAVKSGRVVTLTPHHLLAPWSKKCRVKLLPLLAVRPVQSLSVCTRVHFTYLKPLLNLQIIIFLNVHAINNLHLCSAKSEVVMPTKGIIDIYLSVHLN